MPFGLSAIPNLSPLLSSSRQLQSMAPYTTVPLLALAIALAAAYRAVLRLSPLDPLPLNLPPPPPASGVYTRNALLQDIESIGVGQLTQPEDVAVDNQGRIYVGCADGWVRRIWPDGKVEEWMQVGGRPLGLAVGLHEELLVCEPGQGLLNVTEGKVEVLSDEADGVKFNLTDAVAVASDGTIYFTDASYKYTLKEYFLDFVEARGNGRLLKYDPVTRSTIVLLKNLYFANGVAVSAHQDFLVFCESSLARCSRYWLDEEKNGTTEVFIDNLPGYPDNIKNAKGRFWIGLLSSRSLASNFVNRHPILKQLAVATDMKQWIFQAEKSAWVLAVTEEGKPTALFGDPTGSVIKFVTTGLPVGDYLYLGNLGVDFLGRLKLNSTF